MAHWIEVKEVKNGKALVRLNGRAEWWIEPGEGIKISDPNVNVYRIGTDSDGSRYQGPISLPAKVNNESERDDEE